MHRSEANEEHKAGFGEAAISEDMAGIAAGSVDVKLKNTRTQSRLARSSKNRLVDLLRRNTSRSMYESAGSQKEYRILSTGEDGNVFFWNVLAPYNKNDLSKVDAPDVRNPMNLLIQVKPSQVQ